MAADDLSAPLGQQQKRRRHTIRIPVPQIIAGALALFLALFVLWAVIGDDPFGGEPMVVVPAHLLSATAAKTSDAPGPHEAAGGLAGPGRYDGPAATRPPTRPCLRGRVARGARRPAPRRSPSSMARPGHVRKWPSRRRGTARHRSDGAPIDQKFVEMTPHGLIPKIAADGVRPADAFAQPVNALPGKPDAPRIALIVGGLGVSAKATSDAIAKLPGPVTLAFMPYGSDVARPGRARARRGP